MLSNFFWRCLVRGTKEGAGKNGGTESGRRTATIVITTLPQLTITTNRNDNNDKNENRRGPGCLQERSFISVTPLFQKREAEKGEERRKLIQRTKIKFSFFNNRVVSEVSFSLFFMSFAKMDRTFSPYIGKYLLIFGLVKRKKTKIFASLLPLFLFIYRWTAGICWWYPAMMMTATK